MKKINKPKKKTYSTDTAAREILEGQYRLENKMDLHIQDTKAKLEAIRILDEEQNASLEKHIAATHEVRKDNALREANLRKEIFGDLGLESRITKLEVPRKWLEHTKSLLLYVAAVIGAIAAVQQALKHLF